MNKGIALRIFAISSLILLLITPAIIEAASVGSVQPTSGGGGVAIFAGCAIGSGIAAVTGNGQYAATAFTWCSVVAATVYFATPIAIALVILVFEVMLRFDIAGSAGNIINKLIARGVAKNSSISILPSFKTSTGHETEQDLFKLDNPLNIFLNVNRAFLYIAFFLSFTTIWPLSGVFNFPASAYIAIFSFITWFIAGWEPLLLITLILVFAPVNIYVDVIVDAVNLIFK